MRCGGNYKILLRLLWTWYARGIVSIYSRRSVDCEWRSNRDITTPSEKDWIRRQIRRYWDRHLVAEAIDIDNAGMRCPLPFIKLLFEDDRPWDDFTQTPPLCNLCIRSGFLGRKCINAGLGVWLPAITWKPACRRGEFCHPYGYRRKIM